MKKRSSNLVSQVKLFMHENLTSSLSRSYVFFVYTPKIMWRYNDVSPTKNAFLGIIYQGILRCLFL